MLDQRKMKILKMLLASNCFLSTETIANAINCTEKTVRNDLKVITYWLKKYPNTRIIRKPGEGVLLHGSSEIKQKLITDLSPFSALEIRSDQQKRKWKITNYLLKNDQFRTIEEIAERVYSSKSTVSKDLSEIEKWLKRYDLKLVKKERKGVKVEGKERNWRLALSDIIGEFSPIVTSFSLLTTNKNDFTQVLDPYELSLIESNIKKLEHRLDFYFTDQAILNLIIHIAIAVKRIKIGKKIEMPVAEMDKLQKRKEYKHAQYFTNELEKIFAVKIPKSEISYITLHLLGAKIRYWQQEDNHLEQSLQKIDAASLEIARQLIKKMAEAIDHTLLEDKELLVGLAIHLHSTINRLEHGLNITNPLKEEIKKTYRFIFELVLSFIPSIEEMTGVSFPEDEVAYISLHAQAALERIKSKVNNKSRVLLVCTTGIGTSQLLSVKLKKNFPSLEIVANASFYDVDKAICKHQPELVITTVPLKDIKVPAITVSPILTKVECHKIAVFLEHVHVVKHKSEDTSLTTLKQFMNEQMIFPHIKIADRYEAIHCLTTELIKFGFVSEQYTQSTLKRELKSSTVIGNGIAIPHGDPNLVKKSTISLATLKKPIDWEGEEVSIIFLLAVKFTDKHVVEKLFKDINRLSEDTKKLRLLKSILQPTQLYQHL